MEVSSGRDPVGRMRGWTLGGQDGKRARGPLVVMSVQEEIRSSGDCVDTARGRTLEQLKNSFK